jgi:rhodanese-related sulfurtransferase
MGIQELPPQSCYHLREADPSIPLLDVRSPEEFAAGHPEGALNVPILFKVPAGPRPNPRFLEAVQALVPDRSARVILSCAVGGRSLRACELLAEAGYQAPINLVGGYHGQRSPDGRLVTPGWVDAGLPSSSAVGERGWDTLERRLDA